MIDNICDKNRCTGCFACMNICPKNAIECQINEYGVTLPVIDNDKCIECNACINVCPVNNPVEKRYPLKCFAAWSNDEEERRTSTSGGVAAEISRCIVEQGGIVFGAAFDEKLKVCHTSVESINCLQMFKGSKYVQSYIGYTMQEVKRELSKGRKVLFIGTPCQIAGVKKYVGKEFDNLFLVDLICHGTPPMSYLEDYARDLYTEDESVKISFRDGNDYCLTISQKNNVIYNKNANCDYYLLTFLRGIIQRENCYKCEYAQIKRCSDITLGDFWGLDRTTLENKYKGRISVVLVNTERGSRLWGMCSDGLCFEEREISEAEKGNGPLRNPLSKPKERKQFLERVRTQKFSEAVKIAEIEKTIKQNEFKNSIFLYHMARKIKRKLKRK